MNMPALKYSQINQGFYTFINEDVLPTCGIDVSAFWQAMEALNADFSNRPNAFINERTSAKLAANTKIAPAVDRQKLIQAANGQWSSLFETNDTAQLTKDYLDQHFALASGSHADVKNYVVYYHHLLAFFADGSQCGLANPSQFVALCGHKCAPDSIVLKQSDSGLHIEIVFDRKGERGAIDCAGIQDILVETNETIVIDFNAVHVDGESKVQAYRNLQDFLHCDLQTFTLVMGQQTCCRMRNDVTFTDLDGDDYCVTSKAPVQIRCADQSLVTELMRDSNGNYAPQVIMDAVISSLMLSQAQKKPIQETLLLAHGGFTLEFYQRIEEFLEL